MSHEPTDFVAAMRPGTGKQLAEKCVEDKGGNHDRHDPAGGAAHALEDQEYQSDAEDDVPAVRRSVAVPDIVAALENVSDHRDGCERGHPVPPHDAVAIALRGGEQQVAQEKHEADVHRAQHLRRHDRVCAVEVEQRHHHRRHGDEDAERAGQLVARALLRLDELLGFL